jgi:valyl-tRNA synthetase
MAAQGRDLKLSETRVESYRNFATKLWNAARFLEINGCTNPNLPEAIELPSNKWILSELNSASKKIQAALDSYRFNEAADVIYQFAWNSYCDWYIEFIKPDLSDRVESQKVAGYVLHQILHILHPFMPFISEELNEKIFGTGEMLISAAWPPNIKVNSDESDLSVVIDLITEIRAIRTEMNVPLSAKPILEIKGAKPQQTALINQMQTAVLRLARLEAININTEARFAKGTARTNLSNMDIGLPLMGILDFEAERARLNKEIKSSESEAGKLRVKLSNKEFLAKAPATVIDENMQRLSDEEIRIKGLHSALVRLDADE